MRPTERLEHASALDGPAALATDLIKRALPPGPRADLLHGVPIGQPAHPALASLPMGFWTSATVLDLVPGTSRAAKTLIALGLASAAPAAAAGWADWSTLHREQQRVGLVHAASGACASALFAGSLLARAAGRTGSGRLLSLAGMAAAAGGGFLGRHLAFPMGAGAGHAEPVTHLAPLGWHDLCKLSELPPGRPVPRRLGYLTLVVVRDRGEICVLDDQCAHLGGPLHQGELVTGPDGTACLTCPWHGSTFRLKDGSVQRGPATARQPAFEVRVSPERVVQVRPQHAGRGHD
jgi:nitrite reductase/ring-hydroxylating ferredoxin subunit/uncharacterized membrane protein